MHDGLFLCLNIGDVDAIYGKFNGADDWLMLFVSSPWGNLAQFDAGVATRPVNGG